MSEWVPIDLPLPSTSKSKSRRSGGGGANGGEAEAEVTYQCLPIGDLGADFDGNPMDGAEYLAMIRKEAKSLPFTKTAPIASSSSSKLASQPLPASSHAPPRVYERHPALPKESWLVSFDSHFLSYRNHIRSTLPELQAEVARLRKERLDNGLPPGIQDRAIPSARSMTEWAGYIDGAKRKRTHITEAKREIREANRKAQLQAQVQAMDEEAMMNAMSESAVNQLAPHPTPHLGGEEAGNEDDNESAGSILDDLDIAEDLDAGEAGHDELDEEELKDIKIDASWGELTESGTHIIEPEMDKHKPLEPLMMTISRFTQEQLLAALKYINLATSSRIDDIESPPESLPADTDPLPTPSTPKPPTSLPLTPHHSRWAFSLLLFLEDYIPPNNMSDLRDLAKTCVRIVKYLAASGQIDMDKGTGRGRETEEMRIGCWILCEAVSVGWHQRDLPKDAEGVFAKMMSGM